MRLGDKFMYCAFEKGSVSTQDFARLLGGTYKSYNHYHRCWWFTELPPLPIVKVVETDERIGLALEIGGNSHCYAFSCEKIEVRRGEKREPVVVERSAALRELAAMKERLDYKQNFKCAGKNIIITRHLPESGKLHTEITLKSVANIHNVGTTNDENEREILSAALASKNFTTHTLNAEDNQLSTEKIPAVRQHIKKQKLPPEQLAELKKHYAAGNYFDVNCILLGEALGRLTHKSTDREYTVDYNSLRAAAFTNYQTLTRRFGPAGDGFRDKEFHAKIQDAQQEISAHAPLSNQTNDYFVEDSEQFEYYQERHFEIGLALTQYQKTVREIARGNKYYLAFRKEGGEWETVYFRAEKSLTEELLALNKINMKTPELARNI